MGTEKLAKIRLEPSEKAPRGVGGGIPRLLLAAGAVVLLLAVVLGISTLGGVDDEEASTMAVETAGSVAATPLSTASGSPAALAAGGWVEAHRTALVWPGRAGVVAAVHIVRGERVKEGQLLLELDSRSAAAAVDGARAELAQAEARYQRLREGARVEELSVAGAQLAEAEAQFADADAELERLNSLAGDELVSASDLEGARFRVDAAAARVESLRAEQTLLTEGAHPADLAAARAEMDRCGAALRSAEVDFDLTRLRAPFDGVVIAIELEPGEVVSLFDVGSGVEVADESELWVRVDVPEGRIRGLQLGDRAEVVAQSIGSRTLTAKVVEIAPKADRRSNTVEVAVAIEEPPDVLRPDMSARVHIYPSGGGE
jgi:multidrug resistance efflux pump